MKTSRQFLHRKATLPLVGSIAALLSTISAHADTISWKADAGYYNYWNTAGNWIGSVIPNGADTTVDFTSVALGTDRTLTLDTTSRTVGNLKFGDKNNTFNWTVASSGGAILTLATTTGTAPTITVNDSTRTTDIQLTLAGNNGLTKDGAGQLTLSGSNTYTGLTTVSAGWLKLNNSNGKTLPSTNSITVSGGILTLGYGQTLAGIYLTSGSIAGTATLTSNSIVLESGAVSAPLAGTGGLTKNTGGTVTLSGNNTYSGITRVTAGTLSLGNVNALGTSTLDLNAADTGLVTFAVTGTNTYITSGLTGSRDLALGANTLAVGSGNSSSYTYSGGLSGSGGLTKNGNGTLTLSGISTYSGTTNISSGTLNVTGQLADTTNVTIGSSGTYTVGSDDTVGSVVVGNGGVVNGTGKLTGSSYTLGNATISVVLSGTGTLTKDTYSTGHLTASNTYTGGTIVNGALALDNLTDTLADTGPLTVNSGGSVALGTNSDTVGTVTLAGGNITSTTGVLTGSSYDVRAGSVSAILGGSGTLTKSGTGTVTLSGVNTFSGGTIVNSGTLTLGHATNTLLDTGAVTVNGGELALAANSDTVGAVTLTSGTISSTTGTLTGSNYAVQSGLVSAKLGGTGIALTKTGAGTVIVSGSNAYTGNTTISAGTLQIGNAGTTGALSTSSAIVNNGNLTFNRTNAVAQGTDFSSAAITGNGSLTQAGSSTLTLNASNSYSGGTTVSSGTLILGHATDTLADTGAVTVSGGVLDLGANTDIVGAVALTSGTIKSTGGTLFGSSFALDAGTVSANLAASGAGTGALTKTATGVLTLSGVNTFSGGVNLKAGTLNINNASALGDGTLAIGDTTGSTAVTLDNTSGADITTSVNNNLQNWNQNFTFTGSKSLNLGTGAITLAGNRTVTVTANTLTAGGTITDNASGYSLTKAGAGTLLLGGSNAYSGGTTISAGKIQANHSNSLGSGAVAVSNASNSQLLLGDGVNVGNALTINGGGAASQGALYLASGTATYSGAINVTANYSSGSHIAAGTGAVLNLTGQVTSSYNTLYQGGAGVVVFSGTSSGYTTFSQQSGANIVTRLGINNGLNPNATLSVNSSSNEGFDLAGYSQSLVAITAGGATSTIGNSSTTSDSTLTITGASGGWAGVISDSFYGTGSKKTNLALNGGSISLQRANTYTGATTVSNNGALTIDFSTYSVASNIVSGSSALTLNGSTLTVKGNASTSNSQTFAGTTFNSGASVVTGTRGTGTSPNLVVNLGALTRNSAATVDFTQPLGTLSGSNGFTTTTANDASGFLGAWATVGSSDWATNNGTNLVAYTGYTYDTWASGNNTTVSADGSLSNATTNSLRFNAAQSRTLTLDGTNTIQSGGILVTGTVAGNLSTITGGTLQGANNGELIVIQNNTLNATGLQINSTIADNGVTGLTKSGSGTLTLGAANTYTGATRAVAGTLALANVSALAGSTLDLNAADTGAVTFGVAGTNTYNVGGLSGSRNLAVGANTLSVGGNDASNTYSGNLNGSGGLTKVGTGTQTLSAVNTYTGATTVSGGKLLVSGSGSINTSSGVIVSGGIGASLRYDSSVGLSSNVSVNNGSTFAYNSAANYTGALALTNGKLGGTNWNGSSLGGLTIGAGQTISPGNSPATATTTTQTWSGLGSYDWEINKATGGTAGGSLGWDLLSLSGSLNITATPESKFTINVISLKQDNTAGNTDSFSAGTSYSWLIAAAASPIASFAANQFAINTSGFSNTFTGSFGVARGDTIAGGDATQLYLTYNTVPEPSTWALLAGGMGILGFVQRLRRRSTHVG